MQTVLKKYKNVLISLLLATCLAMGELAGRLLGYYLNGHEQIGVGEWMRKDVWTCLNIPGLAFLLFTYAFCRNVMFFAVGRWVYVFRRRKNMAMLVISMTVLVLVVTEALNIGQQFVRHLVMIPRYIAQQEKKRQFTHPLVRNLPCRKYIPRKTDGGNPVVFQVGDEYHFLFCGRQIDCFLHSLGQTELISAATDSQGRLYLLFEGVATCSVYGFQIDCDHVDCLIRHSDLPGEFSGEKTRQIYALYNGSMIQVEEIILPLDLVWQTYDSEGIEYDELPWTK